MDFSTIGKLLEQGVSSTFLIILLMYVVSALWKKLNDTQDSRVKDSIERESTVTIALEAATHTIESAGETMKSILITLEKQDGQSKTENKD